MFDLSEENIARLLIQDAQQLADRAKGALDGLDLHAELAYLSKHHRCCARQRLA